MATKDEIATAIKIIKDIAGDPSTGAIKELLDLLGSDKASANASKEERVVKAEETR